MPRKLDAKLLDENLEAVDNIKIGFEPRFQSISFYDDSLANSMFKIQSTNIVFMDKSPDVDISKYIYIDDSVYKIIKLNTYNSHSECLVYKCNNIFVNIPDENKELENYKVLQKDIPPKPQKVKRTLSTFRSAIKPKSDEDILIIYKVK